ncbi:helix-turn-helix transcriptional regulator [Flavobacterium sp.]|uniref:helix-turn-helix domain-containing protein n=1 Tax=Flavobacterium sp. TaxID=239 RepID=UPI0025F94003|nr:helix-turn-helix transcriptional regulator [Flavobacterium sp.]
MTTGITLKLLQEKRKLSQEELAYKIGVVQATIGNWERGKSIKMDYIPKLATILEVTASYFMDETQTIINQPTADAIVNKETGFEITIKTPNTLFDDLNKKMDFIINRFNGIL